MHSCRDPETAVLTFWLPGGVRGRPLTRRPAAGAAAVAEVYIQMGDKNVIIINYVRRKWKIRDGAIVENVVSYVCAKFGDDRL